MFISFSGNVAYWFSRCCDYIKSTYEYIVFYKQVVDDSDIIILSVKPQIGMSLLHNLYNSLA